MVFKIQSLSFVNDENELVLNDPVFPSLPPYSPPPSTLCNSITEAFSAFTTQLQQMAAPVRDLTHQKKKKKRIPPLQLRQIREFSFRQLKNATGNFSDRNRVGEGGFGTVYRGKLADGSIVAIKRLRKSSFHGEREFQAELEVSSMAMHRNLLRLYGYCTTSTECLLVYPFMANGDLRALLESRPPNWATRKRIALGIAKGLAHLHDSCDRKIIHRDVKLANVLLDHNFEALVSDFGLARLMEHSCSSFPCWDQSKGPVEQKPVMEPASSMSHITTAVCGTNGYLAPEYITTGRCSEKTDVYAFGITILQLTSGIASNFKQIREFETIYDWLRELCRDGRLDPFIDPNLREHLHTATEDEVKRFIKVGLLCIQKCPNKRPKMLQAIAMLEGVALSEECEECYHDICIQLIGDSRHPLTWSINYPSSFELSGPR